MIKELNLYFILIINLLINIIQKLIFMVKYFIYIKK